MGSSVESDLLSKKGQDVRVILFRDFDLVEEVTVELKSSSQMVQSLLKVLVLQVCLTKLRIGCH